MKLAFTALSLILASLALTSHAYAAAPTKADLDQSARAFITSYTQSPEGFATMDFLKTAATKTYYSVSKYHDYDSGSQTAKIVGVFTATDGNKKVVTFGILFDQNGKAIRLLGLTPVQEECVPYIIYAPGTYTVYFNASDRSSQTSLSNARNSVIATLTDVLEKSHLQSGRERLRMPLKPNSDMFESQDSITVESGLALREERVNETLSKRKIAGASNVFSGVSRIGNPVMDPFNTNGNAVCTEIR
jgi:hypothetical protein